MFHYKDDEFDENPEHIIKYLEEHRNDTYNLDDTAKSFIEKFFLLVDEQKLTIELKKYYKMNNLAFSYINNDITVLIEMVESFYNNENLCDCVLVSDTKKIYCIKTIISQIPLFENMIKDCIGDNKELIFPNLCDKMELCIKFLYLTFDDKLKLINNDNFFDIMLMMDKLLWLKGDNVKLLLKFVYEEKKLQLEHHKIFQNKLVEHILNLLECLVKEYTNEELVKNQLISLISSILNHVPNIYMFESWPRTILSKKFDDIIANKCFSMLNHPKLGIDILELIDKLALYTFTINPCISLIFQKMARMIYGMYYYTFDHGSEVIWRSEDDRTYGNGYVIIEQLYPTIEGYLVSHGPKHNTANCNYITCEKDKIIIVPSDELHSYNLSIKIGTKILMQKEFLIKDIKNAPSITGILQIHQNKIGFISKVNTNPLEISDALITYNCVLDKEINVKDGSIVIINEFNYSIASL
jgi:hypothetical protein